MTRGRIQDSNFFMHKTGKTKTSYSNPLKFPEDAKESGYENLGIK